MSLYSVVHKDRKILQSNQSDSPCSIEHQTMNYEDTESEYASELRRQTYLQKIGKENCGSNIGFLDRLQGEFIYFLKKIPQEIIFINSIQFSFPQSLWKMCFKSSNLNSSGIIFSIQFVEN